MKTNDTNLHANDSIDEEEHSYQQSDIWQGLRKEHIYYYIKLTPNRNTFTLKKTALW